MDYVVRLDPVDAANWLEVIADVAVQRADEALAAGLVAVGNNEPPTDPTQAQLKPFL